MTQKTSSQIFKEVLNELGFAGHKPDQMTNSDYWLCTCTAMERYADYKSEEPKGNLKILKEELSNAVGIIKIWHGSEAWEIYYNNAPEMKEIRETLSEEIEEIRELFATLKEVLKVKDDYIEYLKKKP